MNISPELAELIERHRKLDAAMVSATNAADQIEVAIGQGARRSAADLARLRQEQEAAEVAADDAMFAIAQFPSRTIADVAAIMRIIAAEIHGLKLGPIRDTAGDTLEDALLRRVALDLNRLAAA